MNVISNELFMIYIRHFSVQMEINRVMYLCVRHIIHEMCDLTIPPNLYPNRGAIIYYKGVGCLSPRMPTDRTQKQLFQPPK